MAKKTDKRVLTDPVVKTYTGLTATGYQYGDLYLALVKVFCFNLARVSLTLSQQLWWLLSGTFWQKLWYRGKYERSAQVFDIWGRYKMDAIAGESSEADFILNHNRFDHPEYVLCDKVCLYQVTATKAFFVELPEEKAEIWRGRYGSFSRQGLYENAKRFIAMPIDSFFQIGEKLGDTKAKVVFIQTTARAGSTLMVRVFEETDCCVAICEPDALNGAWRVAQCGQVKDAITAERLLRNTIRILTKPISSWGDRQPYAYCLKLISYSSSIGPILHTLYPTYPQLFMYRSSLDVLKSFANIAEGSVMVKVLSWLSSIHRNGFAFGIRIIGGASKVYDYFDFNLTGHPFETGCILHSGTIRTYALMRRLGFPIQALRYEDLVADPDYSLRKAFEYMGIDSSLVEKGKRAFAKDSQEASTLSVRYLNQHRRRYDLPEDAKVVLTKISALYGVPNWDQDYVLPGTINHKLNRNPDDLPRLSDDEVNRYLDESPLKESLPTEVAEFYNSK